LYEKAIYKIQAMLNQKVRVLFVCLGNICRSPVAEAVFQREIERAGFSDWIYTDSAGTADYHVGELPDPRTRENASLHGIQLTHKGRQITSRDFETFDLILAMDVNNYKNIRKMKPGIATDKVRLFADFHPNPALKEVPDPYYSSPEAFELVFQLCEKISPFLLQHIKEKYA